MKMIEQYDLVLVNLDPTLGNEIKKTRPCVVLSPNEMNQFLNTIIVAPITSTSKPYPSRVPIKHKSATGWVVLDQIRTIDRMRIVKKMNGLTDKEIVQVKAVLQEMLVD
jgi:mRNA interferase MazF